ncbi:hypothetical protein LCGC14_2496590 [marine sediment metagenome]|uniref:Uncharacterized protein n=1 Tax=marine sediment metagenome TaxID=412755 RepID=A0A0F9B342_9ZZZZ
MGLMTLKRLKNLETKIGVLTDTSGVTVPAGSISTTELEVDAADATIVADDVLTGAHAAVVADVNVAGGLMVVHRVLLPSGADANVDVALTEKTRILDVVVILKGAGTTGSDVQVQNVTTAITDLMDVAAGADKAVFRPGTIDDAQQEVAAAANLRVAYTSTSGDFPGAEVYVTGMKVA